jgi:hypothetical protein
MNLGPLPGLQLLAGRWKKRSDADVRYNCAAFAAGDQKRKWWPLPPPFYWPSTAPRENTIPAFLKAYETLGYAPCANGNLEDGMEKIAIFADIFDVPKHVARQLKNGKWISKLGDHIDIEHDTLGVVSGPTYGRPVAFMSRRRMTARKKK